MKSNRTFLLRLFAPLPAALCGLLAPLAAGQVAPSAAPASTDAAADQAVVLNPFILSAKEDEGYAPTETLLGTRMKGAVKDVPTALTIVSADMLKDLGANDYTDVLNYVPSTSVFEPGTADPTNNSPRVANAFTVRGFTSTTLTTNFFTAMTPIDTYNTSQLNFSRGPNSLLFGVGNPGGGIDVVTNQADLSHTFATMDFLIDSFDSHRATVDANLVLVPEKLGIRVDALEENLHTNVKPTKNERTSPYLEMTYHPFAGTTIIVNGETSRIRQNIGRATVAVDQYTPWIRAGRPIISTYGTTTATPGISYTNATGYIVFVEGQSAIAPMNWKSAAQGSAPIVNGAQDQKESFNSSVVVPLATNILGDSDHDDINVSNASFFIQQAIGSKFFVEVAGKDEHYFLNNYQAAATIDASTQIIKVDPNAQLPNGAPNPNVGKPYVELGPQSLVAMANDDGQLRATASYELDLNRWQLFHRGLADIHFGALADQERLTSRLDNWYEVNLTPLNTTGTNAQLSVVPNNIHRRYYLIPGNNDYFTAGEAPEYDHPGYTANGITTGLARVRATPRDNLTITDANAYTAQANLLEDLLVGTFGFRHDHVKENQAVYTKSAVTGAFPPISQPSSVTQVSPHDNTYTVGAVLNLTSYFSLFANKSTNFQPGNQGALNIDGSAAAPVTGRGYDVGLKFSLFGGKLTGSVERFNSQETNVNDATVGNGSKRNAINAIWAAIDPNQTPPAAWEAFETQQTIGSEAQLVANPTSHLRLMLTGSKNDTTPQARGAAVFNYVAANLPLWQSHASLPVSSTLGATVGDLITVTENELANNKLITGLPQTDTYEWQFSGLARYSFDERSWLKGFAVGTSFYWRNPPIIGYKLIPGTAIFDPTQPFYGANTLNVDGWIEYTRAIHGKSVRWTSQLRFRNLLNDRSATPWTAVDDGTGHRFVEQRLFPRALRVSLSTEFHF